MLFEVFYSCWSGQQLFYNFVVFLTHENAGEMI